MDMTIGKRIAALRKEKGLTQEELAQHMGVSGQAVSKWENDQTCPDISALPRLARLLGVTVDELLEGKEETPAVWVLPPAERKDLKDMMLRVTVDSADGDRVRVNLPMALVEVAVEIGMEMPQINGQDALKGVDLNKVLRLVREGLVGNLVEVDSADGDKVRVFVEGRHVRPNQVQGRAEPVHPLPPGAHLQPFYRRDRRPGRCRGRCDGHAGAAAEAVPLPPGLQAPLPRLGHHRGGKRRRGLYLCKTLIL